MPVAPRLQLLLAGFITFYSATTLAQVTDRESERTNIEAQPRTASQQAMAVNPNCTLIVPNEPLSAQGLATPYRLTATDPNAGACNEANAAQSAFVQAAIFDPASASIFVYNPLVIDDGKQPAVAPLVPKIPAGAIVALWFGYNGTNLTLKAAPGSSLAASGCVNGLPGSIFTQVSYCNAPAFFRQANAAVAAGKLKVPPLGSASDGSPCPTVRDFFIVDQDQSDNLTTMYLATADGATAQYSQANLAQLANATLLGNASDNRLLDMFVDRALGCQPWTAPDLTDPGQNLPAQALNELQARYHQATPVALVPGGDPMVEVNGSESLVKTDLYRAGVDQPIALSNFYIDTARYCRQMLRVAPARLQRNQQRLSAFASPDPGTANSLWTFMTQRFSSSYDILNCASLIDQKDPVSSAADANGVIVSATIDMTALAGILSHLSPSKAEDDYVDSAANSMKLVD